MNKKQPYLKQQFQDVITPFIRKELGLKNIHQVPSLQKIVLNTGFNASTDKATIEAIVKDLSLVAGQKALITKAKKSIANFKLREEMPVGAKVTLRGAKMYDFLFRFIAVALPSIRDFRGTSRKLDGRGNYNIGIADHTIFPEINVDGRNISMGMDVTLCTSSNSDVSAIILLEKFGMPFRKNTTS